MRAKVLLPFLLIGVATLCVPARADDAKLREYGKHLAEECASCHRQRGPNPGIVPVEDWDLDRFVATMNEYQSGQRPNPTMASVAKSLDQEQLRALTLYFAASRKPQAPPVIGETKR
jgi:cytochrome c553